jgi:hypothetical protein
MPRDAVANLASSCATLIPGDRRAMIRSHQVDRRSSALLAPLSSGSAQSGA